MGNTFNSMPYSNEYDVYRQDFLENEKEASFMFEPINYMPKEPLPKDDLSALHQTYASFNCTSTCCYNSQLWTCMFTIIFVNLNHALRLVKIMTLKKAHVGIKARFSLTM
jgi:hypothetical protein